MTRRAKARIPSTATHFFWAHGVSNRAQLNKLESEVGKSIAEEHWYFVTFGAFIYVKAFKDDLTDCEVIGINALSPDDFDEKRWPLPHVPVPRLLQLRLAPLLAAKAA